MYVFHQLLDGSSCHSSVIKKLPCLQGFGSIAFVLVQSLQGLRSLRLKIRVIYHCLPPRRISLKRLVAHRNIVGPEKVHLQDFPSLKFG